MKTVHMMNEPRRGAFQAMRRQFARKGASKPWVTYFENDVMGREMAVTLARLGWLTRCPGRHGRLTTISLTDFGMWVLGGAS